MAKMAKIDARYLLAQSKIREAEKLIASSTKKRNKHVAKDIDKNAARHPYQKIDWRNKIKFYVTAIIATNAVGNDKYVVTESALRKVAEKNKGLTMPLFDNFDESKPLLGTAKIDGIEEGRDIIKLVAQATLVVDKDLAENISDGKYAITYAFKTSDMERKTNGTVVINNMEITSISLIPKRDSVDKNCKIIDIYKDQDIDKKLEG